MAIRVEGVDIQGRLDRIHDSIGAILASDSGQSIQEARVSYFHLRAIAIVGLAHQWRGHVDCQDSLEVLHHYVSLGLLPDATEGYFRDNSQRLDRLLSAVAETKIRSDIDSDLADLYQEMLMHELGRDEQGDYYLGRSKHTRDVSGSYYTPPELAWETVRRAADIFVEQRTGICDYSWGACSGQDRRVVNELLAGALVADLSCGAGDFLWAVVRYALGFTDVSKSVLLNCWGYDIDPIALLVTHAELLRKADATGDSPTEERIADQLILGNPLLHESAPASLETKVVLAATGRAYAEGMGVSLSDLPDGHQFDLIVGNPPWEKVRFEERKFFAMLCPDIAAESNRAARARLVEDTRQSDPDTHELYEVLARDYSLVRRGLEENPLLPHIPAGELNTYTLFPVLTERLLGNSGVSAQILKSAIVTSPVNSGLFRSLRDAGRIHEIHLFENTNGIFSIDAREKFCVLLLSSANGSHPRVSFGNKSVGPLDKLDAVAVSGTSLECINPETHLLPNVASTEEFRFLSSVCSSHRPFRDVFSECKFGRLLHLTTHAPHIEKESGAGMLPVFEGKFIGQHDLRFATFDGVPEDKRYVGKARARRLTDEEKRTHRPVSRFFVEESFWKDISRSYSEPYMLAWRSLTSATNTRTMIASLAPFWPATQSVQFLQSPDTHDLLLLAGLFNSTTFDFLVRLKIPGIDLTQAVVRQVPIPSREDFGRVVGFRGRQKTIQAHIEVRVAKLYSAEDCLQPLLGELADVSNNLTVETRAALTSEIDALVALAYDLDSITRSRIAQHFEARPGTTS